MKINDWIGLVFYGGQAVAGGDYVNASFAELFRKRIDDDLFYAFYRSNLCPSH